MKLTGRILIGAMVGLVFGLVHGALIGTIAGTTGSSEEARMHLLMGIFSFAGVVMGAVGGVIAEVAVAARAALDGTVGPASSAR